VNPIIENQSTLKQWWRWRRWWVRKCHERLG